MPYTKEILEVSKKDDNVIVTMANSGDVSEDEEDSWSNESDEDSGEWGVLVQEVESIELPSQVEFLLTAIGKKCGLTIQYDLDQATDGQLYGFSQDLSSFQRATCLMQIVKYWNSFLPWCFNYGAGLNITDIIIAYVYSDAEIENQIKVPDRPFNIGETVYHAEHGECTVLRYQWGMYSNVVKTDVKVDFYLRGECTLSYNTLRRRQSLQFLKGALYPLQAEDYKTEILEWLCMQWDDAENILTIIFEFFTIEDDYQCGTYRLLKGVPKLRNVPTDSRPRTAGWVEKDTQVEIVDVFASPWEQSHYGRLMSGGWIRLNSYDQHSFSNELVAGRCISYRNRDPEVFWGMDLMQLPVAPGDLKYSYAGNGCNGELFPRAYSKKQIVTFDGFIVCQVDHYNLYGVDIDLFREYMETGNHILHVLVLELAPEPEPEQPFTTDDSKTLVKASTIKTTSASLQQPASVNYTSEWTTFILTYPATINLEHLQGRWYVQGSTNFIEMVDIDGSNMTVNAKEYRTNKNGEMFEVIQDNTFVYELEETDCSIRIISGKNVFHIPRTQMRWNGEIVQVFHEMKVQNTKKAYQLGRRNNMRTQGRIIRYIDVSSSFMKEPERDHVETIKKFTNIDGQNITAGEIFTVLYQDYRVHILQNSHGRQVSILPHFFDHFRPRQSEPEEPLPQSEFDLSARTDAHAEISSPPSIISPPPTAIHHPQQVVVTGMTAEEHAAISPANEPTVVQPAAEMNRTAEEVTPRVFQIGGVFQIGEHVEVCIPNQCGEGRWYSARITGVRPLNVKRPQDWFSWEIAENNVRRSII